MTDSYNIYSKDQESQDILFSPIPDIDEDEVDEREQFDPLLWIDGADDGEIPNDTPNPVIPVSFFTSIFDPGWGKPFADLQNTTHTWWSLGRMLARHSQLFLQKKSEAPLFCPTRFIQEVRRRSQPKKIRLPDGRVIEKPFFDGWRCDENVTESSLAAADLDDDFSFEYVDHWLRDNRVEALLYTTASHKKSEPHLRLVIPLASAVDAAMHEIAITSIIACLKPGYRMKDTTKLTPNSLFYFPANYESADENRFLHIRGEIFAAEQWFKRGGLELRQACKERKARRGLTATSRKDWPLSHDVQWSYSEPLERYLATKQLRHPALFGFATATAQCAFHAGYDLQADIIEKVQNANSPSSPYDDIERLAVDALTYAENNIDKPAF
jgi:hypothetical protein